MEAKRFLSPAQTAAATVEAAVMKVALPVWKMLLLGVLAGAYIAFAGFSSNMAAFNLLSSVAQYGLGRALAGAIFAGGLILVVCCGAELFTGNCLIVTGVLDGRVRLCSMLRSWLFVYIGNLLGSVLVAWLTSVSGLYASGGGLLAAVTVKVAAAKAALPFGSAFALGLLCNWLVCLAVWMATAAQDIAGKVLAVFFPIWMFVTSGFEHSIANMFYIPAGILLKSVPAYADAALALGTPPNALAALNWGTMFTGNLLPVTLGNIVGGGLFVAACYFLIYLRKEHGKNHDVSK